MQEIHYQLALERIDGLGQASIRKLVSAFDEYKTVFESTVKELVRKGRLRLEQARKIKEFDEWNRINEEIAFTAKNNISVIGIRSPIYPNRLRFCNDAPSTLFSQGTVHFDQNPVIAIVGTRRPTKGSVELTKTLVRELAPYEPLIISGLAFGIDAAAHRQALESELKTIAVLGHGLDMIYPRQHKRISEEIIKNGALLTEYFSGTGAAGHNFPKRNRIVAGLCDVLVLVESAVKGGGMITARIADSYQREVLAFPFSALDPAGRGTNHLIRTGQAQLIECADHLVEIMGWEQGKVKEIKQLRLNFDDLEPDKQQIMKIVSNASEPMHIDRLHHESDMDFPALSAKLLEMEFEGLVRMLPGSRWVVAGGN